MEKSLTARAEGTQGSIEKNNQLVVFLLTEFIEFHLVLFNLAKCSKSLNIWNVFSFSHISLLLHRKYVLED
jgi:hypothetical protein